jgi:predicted metal-dependent hydrolase
MKDSVQFGRTTLAYTIERRPKRRTLGITVLPGKGIQVAAPSRLSRVMIAKHVQRQGAWIVKQQLQVRHIPPVSVRRQFRTGESVRYLGRNLVLRVTRESRNPPSVAVEDGHLEVRVPRPADRVAVKMLISSWMRREARALFAERSAVIAPKLGVQVPPLHVRKQTHRWGSCTSKGLTLNWQLLGAPPSLIDFVIAHELAHLVDRHHSRRYYSTLSKVAPAWRRMEDELAALGPCLLLENRP